MNKRRALTVGIFGLVCVAILIGLGIWQVGRLSEKTARVAEIEARLTEPPVALPQKPDANRDQLLRVTLRGRIGDGEIHVITSMRPWGPGFRVISPFILADGRRVLVDLGYVPDALKKPADRPVPQPGGITEITGLLLWPDETDGFTPEPDLAENVWFARDVPLMAEALGTSAVLIVAQSDALGEWPRPDPPDANLRNKHLEYALTWFSLAIGCAVITLLLIQAEFRGPPPPRAR